MVKTKTVLLTREQIDNIIVSLNMRRNYIETGNIAYSATDAKNIGQPELIQPLSIEQMQLIIDTDVIIKSLADYGQGR